jgi:hypothetical protein
MKPLKVLVIESGVDLVSKLEPFYSRIVRTAGYDGTFFAATSDGEARKLIDSEWPHVVICDMSLGQESDGLLVLKKIGQDYPDLFMILASKAEYSPRNIFAKKAFFDMFFDKGELIGGNKVYIKHCAEIFSALFRLNTSIKIDEGGSAYKGDYKTRSELRELNALLSQVTFTGHDSDTQITPDTVRISKLAGGFSGSKVYRFNSFNSRSKLESVPAVLKVSEREWATAEINNYNKFVKWGLPYTWRVDVLGTGTTRNFGAVAYSFVPGEQGVDFNSLTYFLERGDYDIAEGVVEKIFSPNMRRWYGDELLETMPNIVEHYLGRYFRAPNAKMMSSKEFQSICATTFGADTHGTNIDIGGIKFIEPTARLFGTPMDGFLSCICHGDLNSNNVIVSNVKDVIFIDFQETGRGHVFEDFVTMESSVRLFGKAQEPKNWLDYLAEERKIGGTSANAPTPQFALISKIRQLAARNFPNEPFLNYYYALAVFHFRLLRAGLTDVQKQKCCAAVIAALARI